MVNIIIICMYAKMHLSTLILFFPVLATITGTIYLTPFIYVAHIYRQGYNLLDIT